MRKWMIVFGVPLAGISEGRAKFIGRGQYSGYLVYYLNAHGKLPDAHDEFVSHTRTNTRSCLNYFRPYLSLPRRWIHRIYLLTTLIL